MDSGILVSASGLSRHYQAGTEVVAALDGVPSPAECTQGLCDRADGCGAASVWIEAQQALEHVLGTTTVGDLLAREDALRGRAPMYHI